MTEKWKRDVKVQNIAGTLSVSIPKDIVDKMSIEKGMVMRVGVELIGGDYVVYYAADKNNSSSKTDGRFKQSG